MSKYFVDKFIYDVDRDPELGNAYLADPEGFVSHWEREIGPLVTSNERADGHSFTDEERRALVEMDIRALFAMGAHPFLLFTWVLPILEDRLDSFPEVLQTYGSAIEGLGMPSWRT